MKREFYTAFATTALLASCATESTDRFGPTPKTIHTPITGVNAEMLSPTIEQQAFIPERFVFADKTTIISDVGKYSTAYTGIEEIRLFHESKTGITYVGLRPDNNSSGITQPLAEAAGETFHKGGFLLFDQEFNVNESEKTIDSQPDIDLPEEINGEKILKIALAMYPNGDFRGNLIAAYLTPSQNESFMYLIHRNVTVKQDNNTLKFSNPALLKIKLRFAGPSLQT